MHHCRRTRGTAIVAHPTEGGSSERNQYGMPPRVAVLLKVEKPEGRRCQNNSGNDSDTADQERLQKAAKRQLFAQRRDRSPENAKQDHRGPLAH